MFRFALIALALLVAGPVQAAGTDHGATLTWSTETQDFDPNAACSGRPQTTFTSDGRFDLARAAYGAHPAVSLVIDPAVALWDYPTYGYDGGDGAAIVGLSLNMDWRSLIFSDLMLLHEECAKGGEDARQGCISMGQVERISDILFKNPGTNDYTPDTYAAPRALVPNGTGWKWVFTQSRHSYDYFAGGPSTTVRQRRLKSFTGGTTGFNVKWENYDTPGNVVACGAECSDTFPGWPGGYYTPGKQGDHLIASMAPAAVAAAEAELLAGPREGEFYLDENGDVVVPFCPAAE